MKKMDGSDTLVDNPLHLPEPSSIHDMQQPMIRAMIYIANDSMGNVFIPINQTHGMS
jgi:translation elongation factor EF-4